MHQHGQPAVGMVTVALNVALSVPTRERGGMYWNAEKFIYRLSNGNNIHLLPMSHYDIMSYIVTGLDKVNYC